MNRLLCFPENYVTIDIEMTGLNPEKDSIIEIAGLQVAGGTIQATFSSLIKPLAPDQSEKIALKEEISALTGITNEMLSNAPSFSDIARPLSAFIGSLPIVGHNVPLDIQFLNRAMEESGLPPFENAFLDTLFLSQKLFPEFIHHKLKDMALYYSIDTKGAHRALKDCYITKDCLDRMHETMNRSFPSEQAFQESFSTTGRRLKAMDIYPFLQTFHTHALPHPIIGRSGIQPFCPQNWAETPSPLFGKSFVFTGILKQMSRREAMVWVANLGGINTDKLTGNTTYLVSGWKEPEILTAKGLTFKEEKALRFQAKGWPISILTEEEFYSLLLKTITCFPPPQGPSSHEPVSNP